MGTKKAVPVVIGLGLAALAFFLLTKKTAASPEFTPIVVPSNTDTLVQEIRQAKSLAELNAYYNLIGELFITREISYVDYIALYNAYKTRYLELTGSISRAVHPGDPGTRGRRREEEE